MSAQVTRIFRFDASGCNGCDIEVLEATTLVSLGELGIEIAERPDDANLLVVTGGSNLKSRRELEYAYSAMQAPKIVVAVGSCASTMGIFKGGYAMAGPIDTIIPVNLYITGCPPRPQVILGALADALHMNVDGIEELLRTPPGFRGNPHVDQAKCVGCAACAHVCPADAIKRTPDGVVQSSLKPRCIGCTNCVYACPFGVPKYDVAIDQMMKCDMCYDRTSVGKKPMCATVCPSQALFFGTPEEIAAQRSGVPVNEFVFGKRTIKTKVLLMLPKGQSRLEVKSSAIIRKSDLLGVART